MSIESRLLNFGLIGSTYLDSLGSEKAAPNPTAMGQHQRPYQVLLYLFATSQSASEQLARDLQCFRQHLLMFPSPLFPQGRPASPASILNFKT